PVLGVFLLGVSKRAFRQPAVLSGLFTGVGVNVALWLAWEEAISWLWWNVIGLIVCVVVILSVQRITGRGQPVEVRPPDAGVSGRPTGFIVTLLVTFGVILVAAAAIEGWLRP
ncbi:MAG TPA: hypothetical protein PLU41_07840, partial [Acidobacteriota bacterium]|nr:hypothetical protein [Acidobacteriota bacterium]